VFKIQSDTEIQIPPTEFEQETYDLLRELGITKRMGHSKSDAPQPVRHLTIDFERLIEVAGKYQTLHRENATIETEIVDLFQTTAAEVYTTSQIADRLGHPTSSISRALRRLVDANEITKIQRGVYKL
jgi:CRP-like cAMP-binding protein